MLTEDEGIEALVGAEFVDEKAFRSRATAPQQPDEILVFDTTDHVYFIVEVCNSVFVIEEEPLHCNLSPIRQHSLQQKNNEALLNR